MDECVVINRSSDPNPKAVKDHRPFSVLPISSESQGFLSSRTKSCTCNHLAPKPSADIFATLIQTMDGVFICFWQGTKTITFQPNLLPYYSNDFSSKVAERQRQQRISKYTCIKEFTNDCGRRHLIRFETG